MGTGWSTQDIPSQEGKLVIVTGANSGVGFYTALELARAGADVILACRNEQRGTKAKEEMLKLLPTGSFELQICDLSSLESVERFCEVLLSRNRPIDILIGNAGVSCVMGKRLVSADGFELQIAANHLGHFAMTGQLLPLLQRAPQPRVITVSSSTAWQGSLRDIDLVGHDDTWSQRAFYANSKLMNLAFTWELNKRYGGIGPGKILAAAAHPGLSSTNAVRSSSSKSTANSCGCPSLTLEQSPEMGALPTLRAATDPKIQPNDYMAPGGGLRGYPVKGYWPPQAYTDVLTQDLWKISVSATKTIY